MIEEKLVANMALLAEAIDRLNKTLREIHKLDEPKPSALEQDNFKPGCPF